MRYSEIKVSCQLMISRVTFSNTQKITVGGSYIKKIFFIPTSMSKKITSYLFCSLYMRCVVETQLLFFENIKAKTQFWDSISFVLRNLYYLTILELKEKISLEKLKIASIDFDLPPINTPWLYITSLPYSLLKKELKKRYRKALKNLEFFDKETLKTVMKIYNSTWKELEKKISSGEILITWDDFSSFTHISPEFLKTYNLKIPKRFWW